MDIREDLLEVWLQMSFAISNKRMMESVSFNEAMIYHILYKNEQKEKPKQLTATDLCKEMHMLKSLMNATLNRMEKKGMILRSPSEKDKRQIIIILNKENEEIFREEHKRILEIVGNIIEAVGEEKIRDTIPVLQSIVSYMNENKS